MIVKQVINVNISAGLIITNTAKKETKKQKKLLEVAKVITQILHNLETYTLI